MVFYLYYKFLKDIKWNKNCMKTVYEGEDYETV
jgi:hypothetical protein